MNKTETTYRTRTLKVGNVTVNIHRPVLSAKERVREEENIVIALSRYGKAVIGEMKQ